MMAYFSCTTRTLGMMTVSKNQQIIYVSNEIALWDFEQLFHFQIKSVIDYCLDEIKPKVRLSAMRDEVTTRRNYVTSM